MPVHQPTPRLSLWSLCRGGRNLHQQRHIPAQCHKCNYQHRLMNLRLPNTVRLRHLDRSLWFILYVPVLSALQLTCTYSLQGSLPLHCPTVRALHDTFQRSLQPLSSRYKQHIIVVTNLRPLTTPRHTTRDSRHDPVCIMTWTLNIPTRFLQYLHTLLVSPSHSSIVPALTFGHQHCALLMNHPVHGYAIAGGDVCHRGGRSL